METNADNESNSDHRLKYALLIKHKDSILYCEAKGSYTDYVSLEGTIHVTDLTSGTILAINHASVVPVSRTKNPSLTPLAKAKKMAKATITDKHHPIFSITSPDPYIWDGWIYIGIQ